MPLYAINDRSLADQVFDQLVGEIMAERYPAGATLPSERTLTEVFGVNRHVVREAVKRLEQLGLLKTSRGGSTRVLEFKRRSGLDLLAMMAEHARGGEEISRYLLAVLEMRAALGADVVRLCALHATPEIRTDLIALSREMAAAPSDEILFALEIRFWERLLDGADNIAYRLAFNSLVKGTYVIGKAAQSGFVAEIRATAYRAPIADAILAGDAEKAESIARAVMRHTVDTFAAGKREEGRFATSPSSETKPLTTIKRRTAGASRRRSSI